MRQGGQVWLRRAASRPASGQEEGDCPQTSWARTPALRALETKSPPFLDPVRPGAPEPGSELSYVGGRHWPRGAVPQGRPCSP